MAITAGVPGLVLFGVLFLVNLFLIGTGSSGAVPFGTFVALGLMWVLIDVPLSVVGGWIGIRHGVSTLHHEFPPDRRNTNPCFSCRRRCGIPAE